MSERIARASPRLKARLAGAFYLLTFLIGGVALFATGRLVVRDNAAATAANILTHRPSLWLGFAAFLLVVACYVVVTALFYELFRPVNRSLSVLATFFSLTGCAIQASICALLVAPAEVLGGGQYLGVFSQEQLQAAAYMLLKLYSQAFNIPLAFFGIFCVLIGYLILRSTFLPRFLGVLMVLAGVGWLTFVYPPLATRLDPYIRVPGLVGEGALTLWLLAVGVNVERWREQAGAGVPGARPPD